LLIAFLAGVYSTTAQQPLSDGTLRITAERNLLYADSYVQDSIPARLFLESGVQFPLIDSTLVWSHPESFGVVELESPVRFHMAGGVNYTARYKLLPDIRVGSTHSLCDTYVVDLRKRRAYDVMYPLNTFTTDSIEAPGIFELDIRGGTLRMLAPAELPEPGAGWDVYDLGRDEKSGMYYVDGALKLANERGRSQTGQMKMVVDLGNANLLALFAFKPEIKRFVSRSPVEIRRGHTPGGAEFRVLMPAVVTFMDGYVFRDQQIVILDNEMRLPGDGFLGVRFFTAFRVIFDLRHGRLWLDASQ